MRILLVDDHAELRDLVARALVRDGHVVEDAATLSAARTRLAAQSFDLIVLDLGLPDGDGEALCRELRRQGRVTAILVLTARGSVTSRVTALDAGADDYLRKPFAVAELRARVRALGRRRETLAPTLLRRGDVALDFAGRRAFVGDREAPLTAREWAILELLARRGGRVVSRDAVLDGVWGEATERSGASLEVLIARIRRKLAPELIRTVRGEGYALGP